jgi:5-methylcytosine-specific restriction endonuclease McrA
VSNAPRNTATRDKHRAAIRRTRPACGICGNEIDFDLPHLDPMSFVVDHILPLNRGGVDGLENKQAAHRSCNRAKSDKLAEELGPRTFVTARSW